MRSNLPLLIQSLAQAPLAVDRAWFDLFAGLIRKRGLEGLSFNGDELHAELAIAAPRAGKQAAAEKNVQVIPIVGTIANRAHSFGDGAIQIGRRVDQAVADARIDAIVLEFDTPGGTVTGVPELAGKIKAAAAVKPVVAAANGMAASAGYWLASQANEVVASPSSEVGSIGVFAVHMDESEWLKQEGVVLTEISAGKYKTEGAPWKPLDAAGEEFFRTRVSESYEWFTKDVAEGRGDSVANVKSGYGEGRVLAAKAAKAAGLIDRVETLDQTIARLTAGGRTRRARVAAMEAAATIARRRA